MMQFARCGRGCVAGGLWAAACLAAMGCRPSASSAPRAEDATTVVAVIPAPGSQTASALAELLELQLQTTNGLRVVNRSEFKAIIDEQVLAAALSAEGTEARLKLGKLLKADLLALIGERRSTEKDKDTVAVELSVPETRHGLRLIMDMSVWRPEEAEKIAARFAGGITRARDLTREAQLQVFAVSPFESKDIVLDYQGRRRGYARLLEEYLMGMPGVAVVELAEAQSLAREVAIGDATFQRDLPYYIFGSYKTRVQDKAHRISLNMELRHGEQVLGKCVREMLPPDQVAEALRASMNELLPRHAQRPAARAPAGTELRLLTERANVFATIGEWDEAMPLYESCLLLAPNDPWTHLKLFQGHATLLYRSPPLSRGRVSRDYSSLDAYLAHASFALDHFELLLRQSRFNAEAVDVLLTRFHWGTNLRIDSFDSPERLAVFNAILQREFDFVLGFFGDREKRHTLSPNRLHELVANVWDRMTRQISSRGPGRSIDNMCRFLEVLNRDPDAEPLVASCVTSLSSEPDEFREGLLGILEKSRSPRMRQVVLLARRMYAISDQAQLDDVVAELSRLSNANGWSPGLAHVMEKHAREQFSRHRSTQGSSPEGIMVPRLIPIQERLRLEDEAGVPISDGLRIRAWLSVGSGQEVVSTQAGIGRLIKGERLVRISRASASRLYWDGQCVWALATRPEPAILVLDPTRGEVARFGAEVTQGTDMKWARLAAVKPGQACFVGWLGTVGEPMRTWVTLLEVEPKPDGALLTRTRQILEARRQMWTPEVMRGGVTPDVAFCPQWAMVMPGDDTRGPWLIVERNLRTPLIIDLRTGSVTKQVWPHLPSAVVHDRQLYIGSGEIGVWEKNVQRSCIWRTDRVDARPQLFFDFGESPLQTNDGLVMPYYSSMLVHEGRLHLLTDAWHPYRPVWTALDMKTRQASILVEEFPAEFRRAQSHELCLSETYGLVLLSGGRAFRVELPPPGQWPRLTPKINPAHPPWTN